jgi:hypothetical protein
LKKVADLKTANRLRALVRMGKARVVKELVSGEDPKLFVESASGAPMALVGQRYRYMFEAALIEQGSGDGLFEGFHQTTVTK